MMPPPGLQIYLPLRMTLTFDLLTHKVDCFVPLPWRQNCFIRLKNLVFTS